MKANKELWFSSPTSATKHRQLIAAAALGLGGILHGSAANAQVEVRCPTGWSTGNPILPSRPGQRALPSCRKEPMQVGGVQLDAVVPAGSEEGRLAVTLLMASGFPPPEAMPTLREEMIGTIRVRMHEVSGQGEGVGGTATRVSGVVGLVTIGQSTLAIRALSTDARGTAQQALRAYLPALIGLDGSTVAWRAGLANCPAGTSRGMADGLPANGLHRSALCTQGEEKQIEVLESRLPVRTVADARTAAEFFLTSLRGALTRVGGTATMDEPVPVDGGGAHGWYFGIHGTAANPSPGSSGQIRVDQGVAIFPTTIGHAQVVASAADATAAAVRTLVDSALLELRLDGSAVSAPTVATDGGAGPAAATGNTSRPAAPPPTTFDPNAPMWQPPPNERPRATPVPAQKGPCGCRTVGAPSTPSTGLTALIAAVATLVASRKRRVASPPQRVI